MTSVFRLSLLAIALGAVVLVASPTPAGAAMPSSGYEEVAQAGQQQARPRQRQRRPRAQASRSQQRQTAQPTRRQRARQG